MTLHQDNPTLGRFSPPSYATWLGELRALFPVKDEFLLADAIYGFAHDFESGLSPADAYSRFDEFVSSEA